MGDEELNERSEDSQGTSSEEVVQGEVGRCPLWKALWTTTGRKARNAILQTIKACDKQDACDCNGDFRIAKASAYRRKEAYRSACREAEKSKSK